jgi:hypothetical protein
VLSRFRQPPVDAGHFPGEQAVLKVLSRLTLLYAGRIAEN